MHLQPPKKGLNLLQLPIMNLSWKPKVPTIPLSILQPHLIENNSRKASLSGTSLHHLSFQSFTLIPLSNLKSILLLQVTHPLLIAFQTTTSYPFLTPLKHHSPFSSLYFPEITHFQRDSLPIANLQHYFPKSLIKSGNILNSYTPTPLIHKNYTPIH